MNVEVKSIKNCNPIIKETEIEHTRFSVVKPENEPGTAFVLKDSKGTYINRKYHEVSKGELRKERYQKAYFISDDKLNIDFHFNLYSEMTELLMKTTLKCQVRITDALHIAKNYITDISEELTQVISEHINNFIRLREEDQTTLTSTLIQALPMELKNVFTEFVKIENGRLVDTQITELGKRKKVKEVVSTALMGNDVFTLVENKELVNDLFNMNEDLIKRKHNINRLKEGDKIKTIENDNRHFDLMIERFEKLKNTGMIAADVTMEAFMKTLSEKDEVFLSNTDITKKVLDDKSDQDKNKQEKKETEEKSYFD